MNINMISVKQLRQNFDKLKTDLEHGKSFILLYRSQPLAEIRPFRPEKSDDMTMSNKIALIEKLAGGIDLPVSLQPEDINKIVDSSYEKVLP